MAAKSIHSQIRVLRCLSNDCDGMLAYEVLDDNVLYIDLAYLAKSDGETRYFPCPKCGGRNVVEEIEDAKGAVKHRVSHFQTSP